MTGGGAASGAPNSGCATLPRPTLGAEALYSARSPAEYVQVRTDRREAYQCLPTDDGHWQGAFDAQRVLAGTGRHRAEDTTTG